MTGAPVIIDNSASNSLQGLFKHILEYSIALSVTLYDLAPFKTHMRFITKYKAVTNR